MQHYDEPAFNNQQATPRGTRGIFDLCEIGRPIPTSYSAWTPTKRFTQRRRGVATRRRPRCRRRSAYHSAALDFPARS
ncbi:MAG: hypothetical protein IPM41_06855 [Sphingomonadales bacterium]|nr:hypothetical protein [Sphingomonadales bacterium]